MRRMAEKKAVIRKFSVPITVAVGDNLRKGAALNAVQIAEQIIV